MKEQKMVTWSIISLLVAAFVAVILLIVALNAYVEDDEHQRETMRTMDMLDYADTQK